MFWAFIFVNCALTALTAICDKDYILSWERAAGVCGLTVITMVSLGLRRALRIQGESYLKLVWNKLIRNRGAVLGLTIIIILMYIALLAPVISPHSPYAFNFTQITQAPSKVHWLGTDSLGRDVFSRLLYGTRIAVAVGLSAVVVNTTLGLSLGLIAGYFGGRIDNIIMRLIEIWSSIPFILLAIALIAAIGTSITNLILIVGITGLMNFTRVVRSAVITEKNQEYVEAARALGVRDISIVFRHILPNCLAPVIVLATLRIGTTILIVAGLSFLGLGAQPPLPSWGVMLNRGQEYLSQAPWMALAPGVAILLTVLAFNLLGDGLRDALDPRLKR